MLGKLIPENFKESSDPLSQFTSSIIEMSKECIPQTSISPTKSNPWCNDDSMTVKKTTQTSSELHIQTI